MNDPAPHPSSSASEAFNVARAAALKAEREIHASDNEYLDEHPELVEEGFTFHPPKVPVAEDSAQVKALTQFYLKLLTEPAPRPVGFG